MWDLYQQLQDDQEYDPSHLTHIRKPTAADAVDHNYNAFLHNNDPSLQNDTIAQFWLSRIEGNQIWNIKDFAPLDSVMALFEHIVKGDQFSYAVKSKVLSLTASINLHDSGYDDPHSPRPEKLSDNQIYYAKRLGTIIRRCQLAMIKEPGKTEETAIALDHARAIFTHRAKKRSQRAINRVDRKILLQYLIAGGMTGLISKHDIQAIVKHQKPIPHLKPQLLAVTLLSAFVAWTGFYKLPGFLNLSPAIRDISSEIADRPVAVSDHTQIWRADFDPQSKEWIKEKLQQPTQTGKEIFSALKLTPVQDMPVQLTQSQFDSMQDYIFHSAWTVANASIPTSMRAWCAVLPAAVTLGSGAVVFSTLHSFRRQKYMHMIGGYINAGRKNAR